MILLAQTLATGWLALWLAAGLRDNLLYPQMNRLFAGQVLSMERMQRDFPEHFDLIAHRAVTSPARQRLMFRLIVAGEAAACLLLLLGTVWLALAACGVAEAGTARLAAMAGALAFTSVWAAFLVCGNHFAYWYAHEAAQNTHFQLVLWGLGTMIFLRL